MTQTRAEYNAYFRDYHRRIYHERKAEIIGLLGGRCRRCGSTDHLEFDHKDRGVKITEITALLAGHRKDRLAAELGKCQLLCHDCHVAKTLAERGQQPARGTHGTLSAYRYCGPPKCEECKRAKREYARDNRPRRIKPPRTAAAPPS